MFNSSDVWRQFCEQGPTGTCHLAPSRTIQSRVSCVKGTSKTWRVVCARVNTWIWFSREPDSLRIRPRPCLNNHWLLLSYQHLPDISDPPHRATSHLNKTRLCENTTVALQRLTPETPPSPPFFCTSAKIRGPRATSISLTSIALL